MKSVLLSLLIVAITGCASNGENKTAKNDGYRCDKVTPLGSSIPKRLCTTAAQRKIMEQNAKDVMESARDSTVTDSTF